MDNFNPYYIVLGVIQSFMVRNGILTIDSRGKRDLVILSIEAWLKQKEYRVINSNDGYSIFEYKTQWKRLIN